MTKKRRGRPPYLQERVEVLDRLLRRDDGDEEAHQPIWVPSAEPIP